MEGEVGDDVFELKGDALNDGFSDMASGAGSRFSLGSRASPSPRASVRSQQPSTLSRRRGRSDATHTQQQSSRHAAVGSASPVDSQSSSTGLATPARSTRSASAAPSLDPRGDQELLMLMGIGEPTQYESLDLSLASRKIKKTLKSLQSLVEFCNLTELNVANNAIGSLDGLDMFTELTTLCTSRNHIKRIDSQLFALVNLRSLDVSGNFISHIPRGIVALEVLEVLNLSGNNLGALKEIDVLAKLANLHTSNFSANPFCKLPTYKDYVVSRMLSLEHLDDSVVSDQMRDKSRRRFSDEMFSKDKFLRDAGIAYASEQNKLREMQLALEAENTKLRDELQLKSKLLQNKSRAWSCATEQLLQLQHDLAMMNLDRRNGHVASTGDDGGDPDSNQPEHHADAPDNSLEASPRSSSPQYFKSASAIGSNCAEAGHEISPTKSGLRLDVPFIGTSKSVLVDAACSPFLDRTTRDMPSATPKTVEMSPKRCQSQQRWSAEASNSICGMMSPHDIAIRKHEELALDDIDSREICEVQHGLRESMRFPAFEDENGCPAYDDPGLPGGGSSREQLTHLESPVQKASVPFLRSPRATQLWERQRSQLAKEVSKSSPMKSPRRSQVVGLVEKDNLVRQIQALQSCKQSLLIDIAKEEQLLHDLKQEASGHANQIEHLEDDMQIMIGTGSRGGSSTTTSGQREEETLRAKLEMLRSKLHYVEDKECEIEATIIRMTKRVLEDDLQHSKDYGRSMQATQTGCGPFDKEVFALTHSLQLVIIEKEEIHSEMSRLMNQLRKSPNDHSANLSTGLSPEALLLIEQHERAQLISPENQSVFIEKQKRADELKRKLRALHDRIKIKEDQIAALVAELKDVESELVYISELIPKNSDGHRRTLSLDSLPSSTLESIRDNVGGTSTSSPECESACQVVTGDTSPRKVVSIDVPGCGSVNASVSSMIEAAAADASSQFEDKFKELFSPEVLEAIKQDILAKLSRQFPKSGASRSRANDDQNDLHTAIATALEVHMKKALVCFEKQRDDENAKELTPVDSSASPKKSAGKVGNASAVSISVIDTQRTTTKQREEERECWDQVDDFMPVVEASYASKYWYVKEREPGIISPATNSKCARIASAQRIRKACERLIDMESECKIDTFSGIEIDASGKKKSDLKVLVMGARGLPTSHLRTKNLDPYVALEIVYPDHVMPQAACTTLRRPSSLALTQDQRVFLDETSQFPNQSFRSRTIKQSLYPVWDEEFEFAPIHSLKGYLRLQVLNDRKLSREQLVGEVKVPLRMLVNQKKLVETFVLRTTTSAFDCSSTRRSSSSSRSTGSGSGTIRVQLQLTFSRLEKCKRSLDDLVEKHLHEHGHLPDFIERIQDYQARLAAPTPGQNPESDSADVVSAQRECVSTIPSFESWKAQQAMDATTCVDDASKPRNESFSPESLASPLLPGNSIVGAVHQLSTGLSGARSSALWSTPATKRPSEVSNPVANVTRSVDANYCDLKTYDGQSSATQKPSNRSSKSASACDTIGKKIKTPASAKAAMAQLRQMVEMKVQPTKSLPNTGPSSSIMNNHGRRKTVGAPTLAVGTIKSPDCFDDYSPYHPDFQLLDPLGMESLAYNTHIGGDHTKSASHLAGITSQRYVDNRRTDLRIFKSPGFARREPSGGFPERFIGLDTQTSERMKRIFGRIDSQGYSQ